MPASAGTGPVGVEKIISTVPIETEVPALSPYSFLYRPISPSYWNRIFPYQLLIVEVQSDGSYRQTPYRFTLPISPQELTISMPVADQVEATLTGVNETVGGARFRYINIVSTMGITPTRGNVLSGNNDPTAAINTISGGFVTGLQNLGVLPRKPNEASERDLQRSGVLFETGFWQLHKLKEFLEAYQAIRAGRARSGGKDDGGKKLDTIDPKRARLAFCTWKDGAVYLVKVDRFDSRTQAGSPLEKTWTMQLTAYARVDLEAQGERLDGDHFHVPSANAINKVLNGIQSAREIIQLAQRTLTLGVLGPISIIAEVGRQVSGAMKDLAGIAKTIFDMPEAFMRGIVAAALEVANAGVGAANETVQAFQRLSKLNPKAIFNDLQITLPPELFGTADVNSTPSFGSNGDGLTSQTPQQTKYSDYYNTQQDGDPQNTGADEDLSTAMTVPAIRDASLDELRSILTEELKRQIKAEFDTNMSLNVQQFRAFRDQVEQNLRFFEAQIGAYNLVYDQTYGLPTPTTTLRDPTPTEADFIFATTQMLQAIDEFIVYMDGQQGTLQAVPTPMEYVAGLAAASGIPFQVPRSQFAVAFPYGASLERLAALYLGNPDRWNEIATLNNLRAPYIDEVGFTLPMVANGNKNTIIVSDVSNLYPNQTVTLVSSAVRREKRHIQGIREAGSTYIVQLDGAPDLDRFKTIDAAQLDAFLPGTVNSQQLIYIPSQDADRAPDSLEGLEGVDQFDPLLRVAGVDFLLTDKNHLIVTSTGDTRWAYGLQNLIQYLRIALNTKKNTLLFHPGWGLAQEPGQSNADISAQSLFRDIESFVGRDPAYTGLLNGSLIINGNSSKMGIEVGIRGLERPIPISLGLAR